MRRLTSGARACAVALLLAAPAGLADGISPTQRRSGFEDMSRECQAMQRDDAANPGMLWVLEGETLWAEKAGAAGRACADCHGDARMSMRGVAARHPAYASEQGRPVDLEGSINLCRTTRQNAPPLLREGREMLALSAYIAHQSRGLPITAGDDPRLEPFRARGEALFRQRQGPVNPSCAPRPHDRRGQPPPRPVLP